MITAMPKKFVLPSLGEDCSSLFMGVLIINYRPSVVKRKAELGLTDIRTSAFPPLHLPIACVWTSPRILPVAQSHPTCPSHPAKRENIMNICRALSILQGSYRGEFIDIQGRAGRESRDENAQGVTYFKIIQFALWRQKTEQRFHGNRGAVTIPFRYVWEKMRDHSRFGGIIFFSRRHGIRRRAW